MEMHVLCMQPKERIFQLLATYPQKPWMQKELAELASCSRPYVSKLVGELELGGIIAKPYKNQLRLVNPQKLLMMWANIRKLPEPVYLDAKAVDVEARLGKEEGYAMTLLRAAWHRTHFMKTERIDLYVDDSFKLETLGERSDSPTTVAAYREANALEGSEEVGGLRLVALPLNYVDLVAKGHSRVAEVLAQEGL